MAASRLEQLRRRVDADPASIAFAQLAEEYRRIGELDEAVRVGRAGLAHHPVYLSARVTLGRALTALGRHDEARVELEHVIRVAPDNLAAIRGLAELHQHLGLDEDEAAGPPAAGPIDAPELPRPGDRPAADTAAPVAGDPLRVLGLPPGEPAAGEPLDLSLPPLEHEPRVAAREPIAIEPLDVQGLDLETREAGAGGTGGDEFALPRRDEPTRGRDTFDLRLPGGRMEESEIWANADGPPDDVRPGSILGLSAGPRRRPAEPLTPVLPAPDPAIEPLERWLAAVRADRATRGGSSR